MDHGYQMLLQQDRGTLSLMANPDYKALLGQIAAETDPTAKQALIDKCYVFLEPLSQDEEDLFAYSVRDYFADNPDDNLKSFVGVYL